MYGAPFGLQLRLVRTVILSRTCLNIEFRYVRRSLFLTFYPLKFQYAIVQASPAVRVKSQVRSCGICGGQCGTGGGYFECLCFLCTVRGH
jgi:hypothetical protein